MADRRVGRFMHEVEKYRQLPPTGSLLVVDYLPYHDLTIAMVDRCEPCSSTTMQITCGELFSRIAVYLKKL